MTREKQHRELYENLLAFYRAQHAAEPAPTPIKPTPPPELVAFESRFQGCSLGAFPWPDRRVMYRVTSLEPTPAPKNACPILIATSGKGYFAQWDVCGQTWVIVSPAYEVLDSWLTP